jgi:hypothetical protein
MSSNIESSDDREREDELDLGQEDEGALMPGQNRSLEDDGPRNKLENGTMVYFEEDLSPETDQDQTPDKTIPSSDTEAGNLPVTPRIGQLAAAGSPDETASTPDDTPSLHVGVLAIRMPSIDPLIVLGLRFHVTKQQCSGAPSVSPFQSQSFPSSV